jgi:phage-related protein
MKPLFWLGSSRRDLRGFPAQVRRAAGFQLRYVQAGFDPADWKPMKSIGPGVREIRLHAAGEFRVIYTASIGAAVYVLHAFSKKAQRTPKADLDLARERLRLLRAELGE